MLCYYSIANETQVTLIFSRSARSHSHIKMNRSSFAWHKIAPVRASIFVCEQRVDEKL